MAKTFFLFLILLNASFIYGKGVEIKALLINNTWLKADLLKCDKEGNLTIQLDNAERILRRKEYKIVKMTSISEMRKVRALFKQKKMNEAAKVLESAAAKYHFPPTLQKIKVTQAQIKILEDDLKGAVSLLEPLLKDKMAVPEVEAKSYAHGFLLLGNAYAALKQRDNAVKAYRRSFELAVPEYSVMANLILGKMFLEEKKTQAAVDCFLENIAVFSPEVPGRKFSLQEIIEIYEKEKSSKLKLYEDMLKKDYPLK